MREVLKFVARTGSQKKKAKKIACVFCQNNSILRPF